MKILLTIFLGLSTLISTAQSPIANILSEKERAALVDEILEDRMDNLLPQLMDRSGIDMWIIISREYNEDPVMKTMLPSTWLSARRRTIMVFNKTDDGLDKIAIARYSVGKLLKGEWKPSTRTLNNCKKHLRENQSNFVICNNGKLPQRRS